MSLRFGRVVQLSDVEVAPCPRQRPAGRVVDSEIAQAATRAKRLVADAEAVIAAERLQFETSLGRVRDELRIQARAEIELELAARVIEGAALRQRNLERAGDDIVELAKLMAERVIGEALTLNPARLVSMAQRCIAESRGSSQIVIFAHPGNADELSQGLQEADPTLAIRVEPDAELQRGDLRIETDVGTLDARIGTQLANLAAKLRESLRV